MAPVLTRCTGLTLAAPPTLANAQAASVATRETLSLAATEALGGVFTSLVPGEEIRNVMLVLRLRLLVAAFGLLSALLTIINTLYVLSLPPSHPLCPLILLLSATVDDDNRRNLLPLMAHLTHHDILQGEMRRTLWQSVNEFQVWLFGATGR